MEKALLRLQRRPPRTEEDPTLCSEWAKIQPMDFVQAIVKTEFAVNYLGDYSLEIFEDLQWHWSREICLSSVLYPKALNDALLDGEQTSPLLPF
ncbi:hypothetical protein F2Q68_00001240 [Brassica cretica]|uniref:Lipoxygenase domain-containing protein n=2 Tax=Brassica cretica TaxID=69181 RepID=A0ABQ7C8L9_BRACR|nr:hypothetical protein F2Q68_00001240 [Brassica cretica]KAF3547934.1 hypothetical protein DY000_02001654 [Brassica cretica]